MRFLKVSFTGRVKDGKVFDTTDEKIAKDEGIHNERKVYSPHPILVGSGSLIKGLDEALEKAKTGETKEVEIPPEKGYGQRSKELMRLIPMNVFKQQKINPIPGMPVELDGMPARVQTVAGGRVRVDFNHELAGKTLIFKYKVESEATTPKDKALFLVERNFGKADGFDAKITGKKVEVSLPEKVARDRAIVARKASFAADAFSHLEADEVDYTEVWKNPKKEKASEEKAEKTEKKKK